MEEIRVSNGFLKVLRCLHATPPEPAAAVYNEVSDSRTGTQPQKTSQVLTCRHSAGELLFPQYLDNH